MALSNRVRYQYVLTIAVDTLSVIGSVLLAYLIFGRIMDRIVDYTTADTIQYLCTLVVAFLGAFLCFDQSENITGRTWEKELWLIARFNLLFVAITAILLLATKANMADSRYLLLGVPLLNCLLMILGHQWLKTYLRKNINKNVTSRLVGIVSTTERAPALIEALNGDWTKQLHGLALLDAGDEMVGGQFQNMRVEANYGGFMEWIRRDALDEIYIDIPVDTGVSLLPYLRELEGMGVTIHMNIPVLDQLKETEQWVGHFIPTLETTGDVSVLTLSYNRRSMTEIIVKRLTDIIGGAVGCIISVPIIAIVAIPLKLESPGPLFFKQKRVGLNGRYFYIYKLRSMYVDAEARKQELMGKNEMNGLMFKMTDDPRITKVGKFIRKTSIDELPQFWNALNGTMSLVGTRPPTVDEYERYESHHKRRLSMKPGITGMWQVSGRSDIENFEDVVKMDVAYIDNWSFWLDIKILLKTIGVVFFGRGAK